MLSASDLSQRTQFCHFALPCECAVLLGEPVSKRKLKKLRKVRVPQHNDLTGLFLHGWPPSKS